MKTRILNSVSRSLYSGCIVLLYFAFWVFFSVSIVNAAEESSVEEATPADTVILDGKVFTSNSKMPFAQALAIRDGRFVYVGTNSECLKYIGPNTKIIDADKAFITPGFVDAHTHLVWLGILSPVLLLTYDATNLDELKTMVQNYAAQNPDLPFILAIGWSYDYIPGGIPTLSMADEILSDRALFLWSHDGHTGWVNTKALERMQSVNPTAFRHLTPVVDPETQKPTGILLHFYAINPFDFYPLEELGNDMISKMAAGLKASLNQALSVGVTTHRDVMIHRSVIPMLKTMNDAGCFEDVRVQGLYFINHYALEDEATLMENLSYWKQFGLDHSTDHLILGRSIKLGIDGVPSNHTAFLYEPYADDPDNCGVASWTAEDFNYLVAMIDRMQFQISTHAVGDAAITRVIDAYENALLTNGPWDSRHTIEHNSLIIDSDVNRMKNLGIYASVQPTHIYGTETGEKVLGTERFERLIPLRSLQKAGAPLAFGTDYSIVPVNPIYGLFVAATRLDYKGFPHTLEELKEIISVEDAIRHYTIGSAKALKMENEIGSVEVGKKADLVMFSIDLRDIVSFRFIWTYGIGLGAWDHFVLKTFVDGRIVYEKES